MQASPEYKAANTQTITWLPNPLLAELKRQAKERGVPMRKLVIEALALYLFGGAA
jgi:hypothetical protein